MREARDFIVERVLGDLQGVPAMTIEVLDMPDVTELRELRAVSRRGGLGPNDPGSETARRLLHPLRYDHAPSYHSFRASERRWEDDGGGGASQTRGMR